MLQNKLQVCPYHIRATLSCYYIYGYDIIQRKTGNMGTVDECLLQSRGEEGRVGGEKGS